MSAKQLKIGYGEISVDAAIKRPKDSPLDKEYSWKGRDVSFAWQGYADMTIDEALKEFKDRYGYEPLTHKIYDSCILVGPIFEADEK